MHVGTEHTVQRLFLHLSNLQCHCLRSFSAPWLSECGSLLKAAFKRPYFARYKKCARLKRWYPLKVFLWQLQRGDPTWEIWRSSKLDSFVTVSMATAQGPHYTPVFLHVNPLFYFFCSSPLSENNNNKKKYYETAECWEIFMNSSWYNKQSLNEVKLANRTVMKTAGMN